MHLKDIKPLPEFSGARKDFVARHASFSSMLRLRSSKWAKIIEWLKSKRERRLIDGRAKEDYLAYAQVHGQDKYVEENFETFQKFFYRYLFDCTKDQARVNILAGKEAGVFESYRGILHKGLNISDERRLDVEARVLNPRRAKNEKDILGAVQEWRQDYAWLVEAGYVHSHGFLRLDDGRMAQTILVKMIPSEGWNSMQRHFREHLSKIKNYDDLE